MSYYLLLKQQKGAWGFRLAKSIANCIIFICFFVLLGYQDVPKKLGAKNIIKFKSDIMGFLALEVVFLKTEIAIIAF